MEHDVDPEFASHLEWQIRTALSRADRFGRPIRSPGLRRAGMAALVLLSLSVGAGGVVAAEHMQSADVRAQQDRQREILQRRTQIERDVAASRLKHAEMQLARAQALVDRAMVTSQELEQARADSDNARRALQRLTLDIDEIGATSRAPRNDLVAPLVDGRDFVSERLQLELHGVQQSLQVLQGRHDRAAALAQQGMVSSIEVVASEAGLADVRAELMILSKKLEIRGSWLIGDIPDDQVDLLVMQTELELRLQSQHKRVEILERRVAHMQALVENGVGRHDLALEAELTEARSKIELHALELEVIARQLAGEGGLERLQALGYVDR